MSVMRAFILPELYPIYRLLASLLQYGGPGPKKLLGVIAGNLCILDII